MFDRVAFYNHIGDWHVGGGGVCSSREEDLVEKQPL